LSAFIAAMCIGIPMRVVESDGLSAVCEGRGRRERISLLLVGEVTPGQWLLSAMNTARHVLDEEQAQRLNSALDALESVQAGATDFDAHFSDLVNRVPTVPTGLLTVAD
jgi:hydrogenase assembly chaperone HypC/HupF